MKAILYARFSPRPNAAECDSVQKQVEELREYCRKHSITIKSEYTDEALSGGDADRPGLWDAIYSINKGDLLLVRSWDRLARDNYLMEVIKKDTEKRGGKIIAISQPDTCQDTPESRLIAGILSLMAEYQRQIIKARTRAMMRKHQNVAKRRMSYHTPYGYKADGKALVVNPKEMEVVNLMFDLYEKGLKENAIMLHLRENGIKSRKNTEISWGLVRNVVHKPELYNR